MGELFQKARTLMAAGRPAEAAPRLQEARELMYVLVERIPGDVEAKSTLGSVLYGLGSALRSIDEPEQAVEALWECAEIYEELDGLGEPGMRARAADVHARAAQALSALDNGVSAVLESDQAVAAYVELGADAVGHPLFLDLARVLTLNALVMFVHGDGDLAVRSADRAVRAYLSRADEINAGSFEEVAVHGRYLRDAAEVAARVHTAQDRPAAALAAEEVEVHAARQLARSGSPGDRAALADVLTRHGLSLQRTGLTEEGVHLVQEGRGVDREAAEHATRDWRGPTGEGTADHGPVLWSPSFSRALADADAVLGGDRVPQSLRNLAADPTDETAAVIPSQRCDAQLAPVVAGRLAQLAVALLADPDRYSPEDACLLGREAHLLFAVASRAEVLSLRQRFGDFGVDWARLLLALIPAYEAQSDGWVTAQELVRWLDVVAGQLEPFAGLDEETARLVEECRACAVR
ncbi:hypothetical protein ABZ490_40540 [Streptomyces sp. NPDC005811]|uniref:hypothetical protein n=1 Tax=Streptomyces sp. NPDC005811 TaxID=3154565 RepID=UPI0033E3E357